MVDLGDAPSCSFCGSHHDQKRQLLPLHELRQHQRLQLKGSRRGGRIRPPLPIKRTASGNFVATNNEACSSVEERPFEGRVAST